MLSATASQLSFDLTANRLNYDSSVAVGAGVKTTALWTNVPNTYTAYAWQPGQLTSVGPRSVTMMGPGGASFKLDVDVKGLQYGGVTMKTGTVDNAPSGNLASHNWGDGVLITGDANGYSSTTYTTGVASKTVTPFNLIRPLFTYNEKQLIDALNPTTSGIDRPTTGTYRASIPLNYRYRVLYTSDGIWTYETRTFVFNIDVKFLAGVIERIDVVGDGEFILTYPEDRIRVLGRTIFNVTATGIMPSGLRMKFVDHNRNYHLKAVGANAGSPEIPYNLTLEGRGSRMSGGSRTVVRDGRFEASNNGEIIITGNDITTLRFDLIADFDSPKVPAVVYTDTFVAIFDVVIE